MKELVEVCFSLGVVEGARGGPTRFETIAHLSLKAIEYQAQNEIIADR